MTYYEYAEIVFPEDIGPDGYVYGCPSAHGLPSVGCSLNCVECYRTNIVPEDIAKGAYIAPISKEDLAELLGGAI